MNMSSGNPFPSLLWLRNRELRRRMTKRVSRMRKAMQIPINVPLLSSLIDEGDIAHDCTCGAILLFWISWKLVRSSAEVAKTTLE
jgi:hypothetical protein